jgi:hypothetical protein
LDFGGDFTLWMRHGKYATTGFLASKLEPGETQGWAVQGTDGGYIFYMMDSAPGSFDSMSISGLAAGVPGAPVAYDIAMSWDEDGTGSASARNGTLTVYVYRSRTGELVTTSSKAMTNINQTYSHAFHLGRTASGHGQDILCDIEQIAAWDRALSQSEVAQLTAVADPCPKRPRRGTGIWKMDDFQYPGWDYDRFHIFAYGFGPFIPFPGTGQEPDEQHIARYADLGFTAIMGFPNVGPVNANGKTPDAQYDLAEEYNLALIDWDVWTAQAITGLGYPTSYRAMLSNWHSPSKTGYFVFDEPHPGTAGHPANLFDLIADNIDPFKQDDPEKLIYINVEGQVDDGSWYQNYINQVGPPMLSYDHYPNGSSDELLFYKFLEVARPVANSNNLQLWAFVQATEPNTRPDTDQTTMRWIAWGSVAYGVKCLQYFGYGQPVDQNWKGSLLDPNTHEPTERYYWAHEINHEMLALGPTLMKLTCTGVGHLGALPIGTTAFSPDSTITAASGDQFLVSKFTHADDTNYFFMVQNRRHHVASNTTDTIALTFAPSVTEVYEISRVDGSHILQTLIGNQLSVSVKAGNGRLFRIGAGLVDSYSTDPAGGSVEVPATLVDDAFDQDATIHGPIGRDSSIGLAGWGGGSYTETEWVRDGKFGQCIRFARDTIEGWVEIPGDADNLWDYAADADMTVQFWFRKSGTPGTPMYMFTHAGVGGIAQQSIWMNAGGQVSADWHSDDAAGLMQAQSGSGYADGQWHHVAVVKSGQGQFTLYLDGGSSGDGGTGETILSNDVGAGDTGFTLFDISGSMRLSQDYTANNNYLGYMDELAIFDVALAPLELGYHGEIIVDPSLFLGTVFTDASVTSGMIELVISNLSVGVGYHIESNTDTGLDCGAWTSTVSITATGSTANVIVPSSGGPEAFRVCE